MASRSEILRAFWLARRRRHSSPRAIRRHQLSRLRRLPGLGDSATVAEALSRLPLVSTREFAAQFAQRNALGLSLEEARRRARQELETGGPPQGDVSFGLSTGSTGEPGVFLTTAAERGQWIGTILGKYFSLRQLARRRGLDIALLLKHNSRLYTEVASTGRLRLHYFDLTVPLEQWVERLAGLNPQILVAPPSVLLELAATQRAAVRRLRPERLLAAAEPLFPGDRERLAAAYGVAPRGLYQAKEGFLAWGCEHGRLHLNEDLAVFEAQRFASHPDRCVPVITDFTRRSQSYWRTRLDDVWLAEETPCPCGSPFHGIRAVEGRLQDVLLRGDRSPVFPFELDAVLARHLPADCASGLVQHELGSFTLTVDRPQPAALRGELLALLAGDAGNRPSPRLEVAPAWPPPRGEKRRRFQRLFDPRSDLLTAALGPPRLLTSGPEAFR
jgi:putative adenylate-forming enzyme